MPPQYHLLDFDGNGKVAQFDFYTVDRNYGNTGGLGGAFGLFYGVGRVLPFPECQPYKPSRRYHFFTGLSRFMDKFKKEEE
jgi:hypothetical protein